MSPYLYDKMREEVLGKKSWGKRRGGREQSKGRRSGRRETKILETYSITDRPDYQEKKKDLCLEVIFK